MDHFNTENYAHISRVEEVGTRGFYVSFVNVDDHYDAIEVVGANREESLKRAEIVVEAFNKIEMTNILLKRAVDSGALNIE